MSTPQDPSLFPIDALPWRGGYLLLRAAVRRHWFLATVLPLVFVTVAAVTAAMLPRTYSGELRMLARRGTSVMAALADPRRAIAPGFDQPAQGAMEIGLSHAALTHIVREGGLSTHFAKHRPFLMRFKDSIRQRISGPMAPEDEEDAFIAMLESRLRIRVQDDVIIIRVSWFDPAGVPLILTQAQQAFVAQRARLDIQSIQESYTILQRATAAMQSQMQGRVGAFQSARSRALGSQTAKIPVKRTSETLSQLRDRLLERRAYREELERRNRMRRADLQVQIAQQRATLGPRHPDRILAEQSLARLESEEDGFAAAQAAEEAALKAYTARGGSLDILDAASSEDVLGTAETGRADDDPTVIAARAMLRMSADGLQDLAMRTENARIELETARAAVPFKYIVTQPADQPRRPDAPNVPVLILGGLMAGLAAGVMVSLRRYIVAESARSGLGVLDLVRSAGDMNISRLAPSAA